MKLRASYYGLGPRLIWRAVDWFADVPWYAIWAGGVAAAVGAVVYSAYVPVIQAPPAPPAPPIQTTQTIPKPPSPLLGERWTAEQPNHPCRWLEPVPETWAWTCFWSPGEVEVWLTVERVHVDSRLTRTVVRRPPAHRAGRWEVVEGFRFDDAAGEEKLRRTETFGKTEVWMGRWLRWMRGEELP